MLKYYWIFTILFTTIEIWCMSQYENGYAITKKLPEDLQYHIAQFLYSQKDFLNIATFHTNEEVALSDDGKLYALGTDQGSISVYSTETGKKIHTFDKHAASICSLCFTHNKKYLISGSYDNTIAIWPLIYNKADAPEAFLTGHKKSIATLLITSDDEQLLSAAAFEKIKVWDLQTKKCMRTIDNPTSSAKALAISPCKKYVAAGCLLGGTTLYDAETGEEITQQIDNLITPTIENTAPYILKKYTGGSSIQMSKDLCHQRHAVLTWQQHELLSLLLTTQRGHIQVKLNKNDQETIKSFTSFEQQTISQNFNL